MHLLSIRVQYMHLQRLSGMRVLSCVCILETKTLAAILTVFGRRIQNYFSTKKSNSDADGVSAKRNGSADGGQSASTLDIKWTYGKD